MAPWILRFAPLLLWVTTSAHALNSNSNRQIIPLGETEAFMGNAGVGRATDTGAVYYNPAGLADLPAGRVSVTSSVYLSFTEHYDGILFVDHSYVPYQASGFNTIPAFYAAAYRMGDWYGALSILVPSSIQIENRAPFTTANTQSNLLQTLRSSDLWLGLSLARKLDERWSLGVTLFGVQHSEAQTLALDVGSVANPTTVGATTMTQMNLNVLGLSAVFGASYAATDWLHLGLRFQTALVQLSGQADTFQTTHTTAAGVITTTGESLFGTPANYRMPFDFTFGTALMPCRWFALLADVSLQLGAGYSSIPASALNDQVNLSPTPRVNLGMELKPTPWLPVRMGFYYNPSATGDSSGTEGYEADNFYGFTAGVSLNSSRVETGVGAFYIWSTGQTTPFGAPGTTASVSIHGMGGLLTASYLL